MRENGAHLIDPSSRWRVFSIEVDTVSVHQFQVSSFQVWLVRVYGHYSVANVVVSHYDDRTFGSCFVFVQVCQVASSNNGICSRSLNEVHFAHWHLHTFGATQFVHPFWRIILYVGVLSFGWLVMAAGSAAVAGR